MSVICDSPPAESLCKTSRNLISITASTIEHSALLIMFCHLQTASESTLEELLRVEPEHWTLTNHIVSQFPWLWCFFFLWVLILSAVTRNHWVHWWLLCNFTIITSCVCGNGPGFITCVCVLLNVHQALYHGFPLAVFFFCAVMFSNHNQGNTVFNSACAGSIWLKKQTNWEPAENLAAEKATSQEWSSKQVQQFFLSWSQV